MKINSSLHIPIFLFAVFSSQLVAAQEPQAEDYTLSMAGALINDWCSREFESSGYISIHACNYDMAHRYGRDTSTTHFSECAVANGGDIVRIADCMLARFGEWVRQSDTE